MSADPLASRFSDELPEPAPPLIAGPGWERVAGRIVPSASPPEDSKPAWHDAPECEDDADAAYDVGATVERIKRVVASVERELVGFGPLLAQAVFALLTRENLLLFSPAGTAKTLFATTLFGRIAGARVFDTQMSKGTLAEELFGPVDIEKMKRGRVLHATSGTLVDADLAFVDEFFDANDMVLRALLGLFNERVFKKGCQMEKARLHTGIAAANYLRATDVTEAVLDRFLFRAYLAPDFSPFTLLAIDEAFGRHFGRAATVAPQERIPLREIAFLADVARGLVPDQRIAARPHVLLMKNAVLNRYRELLDQSGEPRRRKAVYLSPRTYAKSRIVLNAAALLQGRGEVTIDDLHQLKFMATTIGGPEEQAQCFDTALRETLTRIRPADRESIDQLAAAHELAEQIMGRVRHGEAIRATSFLQRLLRLFGLVSDGQITFDHVRRYVDGVEARDEQVKQLKLGVLKRLQELTRRVDSREEVLG